jgi:RND superfamily putative drug exporter
VAGRARRRLGLVAGFGGTPQDDYDTPGTRSQAGIELLREDFPAASGAVDQVVVHDPDGAAVPQDEVTALSQRLERMPHVAGVSPPRTSADGATVLLVVRYDVPVTHPDLMGDLGALEAAAAPAEAAGLQVEFGGDIAESASLEVGGTGELVGVGVALLLLVLTFGSVTAAGVPILVALTGLAVGSAAVLLLASVTSVSTSAPTVATMVGLGVGIDYAMLLVSRHVELLRDGLDVRAAAARATATAGRSVVFAAATVLVSLMGLRLAGVSTYSSFGFATALAVVAVAAAALTLVPAALGLAGRRVLPRRARRGRPAAVRTPLTARWADRVGRRPLPWALGALGLLLLLAVPTLEMRLWPADISAQPRDTTTRQAYDLVAEGFGPGRQRPVPGGGRPRARPGRVAAGPGRRARAGRGRRPGGRSGAVPERRGRPGRRRAEHRSG